MAEELAGSKQAKASSPETASSVPSRPLSFAVAGVRRRPSLQMLADRPLGDEKHDSFGFRAYATALAELIDNPKTATPLTIAISAPWGAGKTSLGRLLESRLLQRARERRARPHAIVWFNAWKHDDADHLGAAFAADVARQLGHQRPFWWKVMAPLPSPFLRPGSRWKRRLLAAAALLIAVVLVVAFVKGVRDLFGSSTSKQLSDLHGRAGPALTSIAVVLAVAYVLYGHVFRIARAVVDYVGDPRGEAAKGSMDDVSDQLGRIVRQATSGRGSPRRAVIFVDDLERCKPERAIEVCEVATQLLAHPNVVIVILADMAAIATYAGLKYANSEHPGDGDAARRAYGQLYLQKLVQIEFTLPPTSPDELRQMLFPEVEQDVEVTRRTIRQYTGRILATIRHYAGRILAVVVTAAILASAVSSVRSGRRDYGTIVFAAIIVVLLVGWALGALYLAYAAWRSREAEEKIDALIDELRDKIGDDPVELERRVLVSEQAEGRPGLARQRLERNFVDDSELKAEATAPVLAYLPALPRSAKRMLNHLRVLLVIAYEREIFGGEPALTAGHFGKWVVLNERWPELARHLKTHPASLGQLEPKSLDGLRAALAEAGIVEPGVDELHSFLGKDPHLGEVLVRLVYLTPAEPHPLEPRPSADGT